MQFWMPTFSNALSWFTQTQLSTPQYPQTQLSTYSLENHSTNLTI